MLENLGQNPTPAPSQNVNEDSPEKKYQDRVWAPLSDERVIEALVEEKPLQTATRTSYNPSDNLRFEKGTDFLKDSPSKRLIDLGCASDYDKATDLEEFGITDYVGIDADFGEYDANFTTDLSFLRIPQKVDNFDGVNISLFKADILQALHAMPDDYGNIWMGGVDPYVFGLSEGYQLAAIAEMKRVVPQNGFIVTDCIGFIGLVIKKAVPDYIKRVRKIKKKNSLFSRGRMGIDPEGSGYNFFVELPELGFVLYFDTIEKDKKFNPFNFMAIVNVSKTR